MKAARKISAPITSCSSLPAWPTRCNSRAPITTVRLRAANSHQRICSAVAPRWLGMSSGHGAFCNGLMPALISTRL
ncbi:hypothetical protein D3C76_698770 [compost metagenome]